MTTCHICDHAKFVTCKHCGQSFCFDHYEQHVLELDRKQRDKQYPAEDKAKSRETIAEYVARRVEEQS